LFQNSYGEHDAELVQIAMAHAAGLVGHYSYTQDDADDILQTLILAGTIAMARFDRSKAKKSTFLYSVIQARVKNLARDAEREKRDRRKEQCSLDAEWPGDESGETSWSDVIGIEQTITAESGARVDHADIHGLRLDMEQALADLPPKLRELCRFHAELDSEDARRAAGMGYSTHHRAIKRIRAFLQSREFAPRFQKKSGRARNAAVDHPEGNL
jgi:RNA polymerase sigma-70 factor (ECF subfamily)